MAEITPNQEKAILAVLTLPTIKEAAQAAVSGGDSERRAGQYRGGRRTAVECAEEGEEEKGCVLNRLG